jgi:hypothetical protein
MRMSSLMIAACLLMAVQTLRADDALVVRPGKWQVTQTMEMGGTKMPPHTLTVCHKPGAGDAKGPVPGQETPANCKMGGQSRNGNTVKWDVSCTGKEPMKMSGELTYGNDSYEGVMHMNSSHGEMVTHMKGKRLGDC